jgi:hypothetical protein
MLFGKKNGTMYLRVTTTMEEKKECTDTVQYSDETTTDYIKGLITIRDNHFDGPVLARFII